MRDNKFKVQTSMNFCHGWCLPGQRRNLVSGILADWCHNQFRAKYADIKEVRTKNSMGSAKNKGELSHHPTCSPNLAPSDFHLFGPLKHAIFHATS